MDLVLKRFKELVEKLNSTQGRLEKEAFLKEYENDTEVKSVLDFLFNPYIVSGVSSKKLDKFVGVAPGSDQHEHAKTFLELLDYFRNNNTGRDVDTKYLIASAEFLSNKELIYEVVKQSLKLGVQPKTLNKVFGEGFIPMFDVMLAESFAENQDRVEGKEFIITEKLDGVRCALLFDDAGTPQFFTRQGQSILDLVELKEEAEKLDKNFVYDGELLLKTDKKIASKDLYRMTVKITSSDNIKKNIIFNIFDYMPLKDFKAGKSEIPSIERKKTVEKYLNSLNLKWLKPLPLLYVGTDMKKIHELLDIYTKDDQEGIMVNIADGAYECKRSKNLLKVKKFLTADVRVISLEEGTGRNKGKLGAVHVEFEGPDKKLHTCKVGSGFKDEEREYYWQNKNEILGKIIEIGYFEITTNQKNDDYSLRFPTFKHIRNDKDEISMY